MTRRILLATGGTAGHVRPALAVAAAVAVEDPAVEIIFAGSSQGFESRLVAERGYRFERIDSLPIAHEGLRGQLAAVHRLAVGTREARIRLRDLGIGLVLGFGGYASAAPVIAARLLRIPTALLECNARPGLANLALLPFANRIFLAFDECRPYMPHPRVIRSGLPILVAAKTTRRDIASPSRLLITGGSFGSSLLNREMPAVVAELQRRGIRVDVHHQSGTADAAATEDGYRRAGASAKVSPYIEDIGAAYAWASAAVVTAGASTLMELALNELPALILPEPARAWNHHEANARTFGRHVGLPWLAARDWNIDAVASHLGRLLTDIDYCSRLRRSLAVFAAAHPNPARVIARHCLSSLRDN